MGQLKIVSQACIVLHCVAINNGVVIEVRCCSPGGDAVTQAAASEESLLLLGRDEHCHAGWYFHISNSDLSDSIQGGPIKSGPFLKVHKSCV